MKLNCLQLEERECADASYIGNGVLSGVGARGDVRPFEYWDGSLNVFRTPTEIWVGAGVGGGPRIAVFDAITGERTRGDWFAGDPNDRSGVIPFGIGVTQPPELELSRKGVWIYQDSVIPKQAIAKIDNELSILPTKALNAILDTGVDIALTDKPIPGINATGVYLPLTNKILINAIGIGDTTSVPLHELGHAVDYRLLGKASDSNDSAINNTKMPLWSSVHKYAIQRVNKEESWAESFATYWKHPSQLSPIVYDYFTTIFRALSWV